MNKKINSFDSIVSRSLLVKVNPEDKVLTPLDVVLGDPERADRVVEALNLGLDPKAALSLLDGGLDQGQEMPMALRGIGGVAVSPFLRAYVARFQEDKAQYRVKVGGKACDYIFIPDSAKPLEGQGHLSVDVLHEFFETNAALQACTPDRTEFYHWDIEICSYTVHKRFDISDKPQEGRFPNDPFPDLDVTFPAPALDPNDPRSIWCRCLDHKLYAKGKDVKVERVYRQVCTATGVGDEDFHLLDKNDPQYAGFYESTDESCVDIMFKGYPPLAGLPVQREYCIGRCDHPAIVNTGA